MATGTRPFWKRKKLDQLTPKEWESLCDGCGLCCLQKIEFEDDGLSGVIHYTRIACRLLDHQTCRCMNYSQRRELVSDCVQLTPADAETFHWLPATCSYRLLSEGKDLPAWHYLVCGDRRAVHRAGISRSGRMICETAVDEDDWQDHIIFRCG